jgi:hypothetical protein
MLKDAYAKIYNWALSYQGINSETGSTGSKRQRTDNLPTLPEREEMDGRAERAGWDSAESSKLL